MTQKQKVVFPIWIQNSYEGTDRLNEHKAMVFLAKHFGDKINQKLKSKNIEYKFTLQYFDGDDSETPSLEACERVIGWINDTDNCFFSFFPRIARDPERTFEKRNNKKILFTLGDESWKTTPPDFCFDLNPKSITNMETLGWLSGQTEYSDILFLHHESTSDEKYLPELSTKNRKKISSLQIDSDLDAKEIEERLTKAVSGLGNNPLIVTNLFHGSISGEDFADLFLASLKNVETNTTVLCLGYFEHLIAVRNNNPRVEVLRKFVPPWSNQSVIEVNAKIFGKKHNALLDWVSDQELAQFEFANLTADIIAKSNLDLTADGFLEHVDRKIISYNGRQDVYVGDYITFRFSGRTNTYSNIVVSKSPQPLFDGEDPKNRTSILHPRQPQKVDNQILTRNVQYLYFDIIKIIFVDVAAGSWGVEAVIEIISDRGEIIDDISFNNLCAVYPKFEAFLVSTVDEEGTGFKTYVYKLRANFSFISSASYYPFDVQDLFVEYVLRPKLNELLPPIPKPQLDNEFEINGWQHIKSYSSVKRNKSFLKLGANLAKVVSLETANRFGVIIQRHEPVNLIKILAPLTFLTLIAYYCLFLPTGDTFNKLITLVTVFLSGIALYFATEKPQPLEFSLIDKIFQFFYAVLGTNILITLTLEFHLFFGGLLVTCFQILQPIGLAAFLFYLFKEKKKMEVMIGK